MANNKKRKPNTERHKERKTSTTEMTRTLYFIITTLNYMEREVESEERECPRAGNRSRPGGLLALAHRPLALQHAAEY